MKALTLILFAALAVAATCAGAQQNQPPVDHGGGDPLRYQPWATARLERSPRQQRWVMLKSGQRELRAWVDEPAGTGRVPVVIVLHEVFGLTDSTRNTADEVAAMGYLVVVPDMLSGYGPDGGDSRSFPTTRSASEMLTGLTDDQVNADLDAWADYGRTLRRADGRLAMVGLSWGGGAAFRYAVAPRKELKAVFVFYDVGPPGVTQGPLRGQGLSNFPVAGIRIPVHGFYPERDARVIASLAATRDAMAGAGKEFDAVIYAGADHAYMRVGEDPADTNPANAEAVSASLARLRRLLADAFR